MKILMISRALIAILALAASSSPWAVEPHNTQGNWLSYPEVVTWLKKEMSDAEIAALERNDLHVSGDICSCSDSRPHYPYAIVKISTKKSSFLARIDGNETGFRLIPIAIQKGKKYFLSDSDDIYFGEFESTCDFTDARYGPRLAQFFPDCKADSAGGIKN
ncbi:MAG: hypothetical protein ACK5AJ_00465 [bacterium]